MAQGWRGFTSAPQDMRQSFGALLSLPRPNEATIYLTFWQDAQGNLITIVDAWGQPTLLLIYATAKAAGVKPLPPPTPKY